MFTFFKKEKRNSDELILKKKKNHKIYRGSSFYWEQRNQNFKNFKKNTKVRSIKKRKSQKEKEKKFNDNFIYPEFLSNIQIKKLYNNFMDDIDILKDNIDQNIIAKHFNVNRDVITISLSLIKNYFEYSNCKLSKVKEFTKDEYKENQIEKLFGTDEMQSYQNKIEKEHDLKIKKEKEKEDKLKNLITNTIQNEFLKMKENKINYSNYLK
jgi:hypothetical protein